jgi:hypothetical protein
MSGFKTHLAIRYYSVLIFLFYFSIYIIIFSSKLYDMVDACISYVIITFLNRNCKYFRWSGVQHSRVERRLPYFLSAKFILLLLRIFEVSFDQICHSYKCFLGHVMSWFGSYWKKNTHSLHGTI